MSEAYLESSRTSTMELFCYYPLTIFAKTLHRRRLTGLQIRFCIYIIVLQTLAFYSPGRLKDDVRHS